MTDLRDNVEVMGSLGRAHAAHRAYVRALDDMIDWLHEDGNAEKSVLLHDLDSSIRRREQDAWGDVPDDFPTVEELEAALHPERTTSFRRRMEHRSSLVEERATTLVRILDSPGLLANLDLLDADYALEEMAHLVDRLTETRPG